MVRVRSVAIFAFVFLAGCSSNKREEKHPPIAKVDAGAAAADAADTGVFEMPDSGEPPDTGAPPDLGVMEPPDAGDICVSGPDKAQRTRSGIVNGTRTPTFVPLGPEQIMAIVGVTEGTPVDAICSGTLIAPTFVLTAKHCTEDVDPTTMWALFGADDFNPDAAIAVVRKHEHPDHDVALLELDRDATSVVAVVPIPIALFDLTPADFGRTLEQSGYGRTETGNTDGRMFVAEELAGFEEANDRLLVVDGRGVHGVCFGDSGGPSMAIAPEGDVRVVGALSFGDESCVGMDRYARTDFARTWIEQYTGPTPGAGPQPCRNVDGVGYCTNRNQRALYCENNELRNDDCTSGQVCGWSGRVSPNGGWRCVPEAADPCGGIGFYGACNDDVLSWCDRGVVYSRPCAMCGERCVELDENVGFICEVNACGDIDFLGVCKGDVATWCNREGMLESLDCAASDQVCGYVDDQIGYYCMDP